MTTERNQRRVLVGVVVSEKMNKTIAVDMERLTLHPKYKKYIKRTSRYYAHDEKNEARAGDVVELMECRPLSKMKKFRLVRIVRRGKATGARMVGAAEGGVA
jgi:small subunit ribosomal protein S17